MTDPPADVMAALTELTAVGGTVAVAVRVAGLVAVVWTDAELEQMSCWLWHASMEKPGPLREVQDSNWKPQAAPAADERSANSCSKQMNVSPFLLTDGGRPPRELTNSKNVMTSTTMRVFGLALLESDDEALADDDVADASTPLPPFPPWLPFPESEEAAVVEATSTEVVLAPAPAPKALVVVVDEFENEVKDPLPPLPPLLAFEALVVDARSADAVELVSAPFPF